MRKKKQFDQIGNNIDEVYQRFENVHCIANNLSQATINGYYENFKYFKEFYKCDDCTKITDIVFTEYKLYMIKTKKLADTTVNTRIKNLSPFLHYCMDFEYIKKFDINLINEDEPEIETYTNNELERLLKKPIIKRNNFPEYRNWVLINYLLGTRK